ncbi:MAG: hypothetical protein IJS70_00930 [Bacteroidales bacterium]|nr:hypothetical protein [Bacteroidales bacterium]MBQ7457712.1 hypothetical protein [Bacteroidales bacterium]
MKNSAYVAPAAEIFEFCPGRVICQSEPGRSVVYGDEGKAGGDINDDNYVNGGAF